MHAPPLTRLRKLDRPAGNLHSASAEAAMELLRELHADGSTICMVTHDPRCAGHAERTVHLFRGPAVRGEDGAVGPGAETPASKVN